MQHCGGHFRTHEEVMGNFHFLPPEHPLGRYSDSVMHYACYDAWEHRVEFQRLLDEWLAKLPHPPSLYGTKDR